MVDTVRMKDWAIVGDSRSLTAYVSYNIMVGEAAVSRRYSDFFWLSDVLAWEYPGVIVSVLPPKTGLHRSMNVAFIEMRRRSLQRFLQRVLRNPVLSESDIFKSFLEVDDEGLDSLKRRIDSKRREEKASSRRQSVTGVNLWIKGKVNAVSDSISRLSKERARASTPGEEGSGDDALRIDQLSDDDVPDSVADEVDEELLQDQAKFEDLRDRAEQLKAKLLDLSRNAALYFNSNATLLSEVQSTSLAIEEAAVASDEGGDSPAASMRDLASRMQQERNILEKVQRRLSIDVVEPLDDLSNQMRGVDAALQHRQEHEDKWRTTAWRLDCRKAMLERVRAQLAASKDTKEASKLAGQIRVAEEQVSDAQVEVDDAGQAYALVSARLEAQLDWFLIEYRTTVWKALQAMATTSGSTVREQIAMWKGASPGEEAAYGAPEQDEVQDEGGSSLFKSTVSTASDGAPAEEKASVYSI